jgi:hypothetical protein
MRITRTGINEGPLFPAAHFRYEVTRFSVRSFPRSRGNIDSIPSTIGNRSPSPSAARPRSSW